MNSEWESMETHAEALLPPDFSEHVLDAVRKDRRSAASRRSLLLAGVVLALVSNGALIGIRTFQTSGIEQPYPHPVSPEKQELLSSL